MPIGCCSLVPTIATHLQLARPRSVLDLGIGMGFYGAVVRQWVDLGVRPWRTKLVGVEGFAGYRNGCWDLYDNVIVSPIEEYLGRATETWDAILLLDVLEHFPHAVGEEILAAARSRLTRDGQFFVGTPAVWMEQGATFGNEFERHRSLWTAEELRGAGFEVPEAGEPDRFGNQMLLAVGEYDSPPMDGWELAGQTVNWEAIATISEPSLMSDVTQILSQIESGDPSAAEKLLPLVYDELRKLAAAKLAQEKPGQTLQATALVHDAYIRLVDVEKVRHWNSRRHFFGAAAEAMRRILIEQARKKAGPVAGGSHRRVELTEIEAVLPGPQLDVLALSESLDRLAADYPRVAKLVKLRFFAGLTRQEAAEALGISLSTADDDWAYAKGRLRVELIGANDPETLD